MRKLCLRCRRPESACYCAQLVAVDSRVRTCFLQHPRERRVAIGTARMAHLSLRNSELHEGVDFSQHARIRQLVDEPGTAVLFPGEGAREPAQLADAPPRTLLVVDGTWDLARKVLHTNPFLGELPRVGFVPPRPSNYRIRLQPRPECVSTIEAVAYVLGALERDEARFAPLLRAFDWMVDLQLARTRSRETPPRRRRKRSALPRTDATVALLRSRPRDVVCLYAEANAYPCGTPEFDDPQLLQLLALRPATGERFEALVAPRRPLGPEVPTNTELEAAALREPLADALARFARFLRDDDLFCGWGQYASGLLRREGGALRPYSDLRIAAARRLRQRPGGVEQAVRRMGRPELPAPVGAGRGGRRLAALAALFEQLAAEPA